MTVLNMVTSSKNQFTLVIIFLFFEEFHVVPHSYKVSYPKARAYLVQDLGEDDRGRPFSLPLRLFNVKKAQVV